MKKDHKYYQSQLAGRLGQRLIRTLFLVHYKRLLQIESPIAVFSEFKVSSKKPLGSHKTDKFFLDAAIMVPGDTNDGEILTVGFEIKDTLGDLMYGEKLEHEIGHTNYMFLAVPSELLSCAICIIKDLPEDVSSKVGLIDLDKGDIVFLGEYQQASVESLGRFLIESLRQASSASTPSGQSIDTDKYIVEEMGTVGFDGKDVNEAYLEKMLEAYRTKYNYDAYRPKVHPIYGRYKDSPRFKE